MILKVAVVLLLIGAISAFDLRHAIESRKANQVCYQHPMDIVFILDASASIWSQNFTKAKDFVNSFIDPYVIGQQKVRIALETYADEVYVQDIINFRDFNDKKALQKHIKNITWHAGPRTETGMAITYMKEHIMTQNRPGLPKICIVITDGNSQEPNVTAREAKKARDDNIDMFAIGVSKAVKREELENIAGSPDRVIIVETYSELEAIKDKLSGKTCRDIPTEPPTQAAEECGQDTPTDVYYVFDPAHLGADRTSWVTQFITHTLEAAEFTHMRVGVISGSCPLDAGFALDAYSRFGQVRTRLEYYDSSKLFTLIGSLTSAYSNGGRANARKVAVIFVGGKIDQVAVIKSARAAHEAGVAIYLADAGNAPPGLFDALQEEGIAFSLARAGSGARRQAVAFVDALCENY